MKFLRISFITALLASAFTPLCPMDMVNDTVPIFRLNGEALQQRRRLELLVFEHNGEMHALVRRRGLLDAIGDVYMRARYIEEMDTLLRSMFHISRKEEGSEMFLNPELAAEGKRISELVSASNGAPFNVLISGSPGTGKTMFAKQLVPQFMEYIYLDAANLLQFDTELATVLIQKLFHYAEMLPCIRAIVIDDADALLGNYARAAEKRRKMIKLVLEYMNKKDRSCTVILITNREEAIPGAILNSCAQRIHFKAPDKNVRLAILKYAVNKIVVRAVDLQPATSSRMSWKYWFGRDTNIVPPTIEEGALSDEVLEALADRLEGFVPREIICLVRSIQDTALATNENIITPSLINGVVAPRILEHQAMRASPREPQD